MSFKRDSDGFDVLQNLNNLRVKELLGNHIPEDEAKLLSNGRLVCMICLHRPIFDTINILSLHRKGKKHLQELSKHIQCKERLLLRKSFPLTGLASNQSDPTLRAMLGARLIRQTNRYRKTLIEIPPRDSEDPRSGSATVRRYIKSMSRKLSLEKVVEKSKDSYGEGLTMINPPAIESACIVENSPSVGTSVAPTHSSSWEDDLKLKMSGWIKDSLGNWTKDPNVEFDSDEEEPPV